MFQYCFRALAFKLTSSAFSREKSHTDKSKKKIKKNLIIIIDSLERVRGGGERETETEKQRETERERETDR